MLWEDTMKSVKQNQKDLGLHMVVNRRLESFFLKFWILIQNAHFELKFFKMRISN